MKQTTRLIGQYHENRLVAAYVFGWHNRNPSPKAMEDKLYRIMCRWGARKPRRRKTDSNLVDVDGEPHTERWLLNYFNLRSVQPCCYVSAQASNRMTGEKRTSHSDMPRSLDGARLFAAQQIIARHKRAVKDRQQRRELVAA